MLLTVIVPDKQPGMARMLKKELGGIDAEVIKTSWSRGLLKAKGSFVCLLEKNSAVSPGSIKRNLSEFIENPKYRKLAMVSPTVDPAEGEPHSWTYDHKGLGSMNPASSSFHSVRIGNAYGAIIRKSSLKQARVPLKMRPDTFSTYLSLYFWENGLRIAMQPESVYYAPENVSYKRRLNPRRESQLSETVWEMWEREWIS